MRKCEGREKRDFFFEKGKRGREQGLSFTFRRASSESFCLSLFSPCLSSPALPPPSFPPRGSRMFRGAFQTGYITVFNAVGSKPLQLWETDGGCAFDFFRVSIFRLEVEDSRSPKPLLPFLYVFFPVEAYILPCHFLVTSKRLTSRHLKRKKERGRRTEKRKIKDDSSPCRFPLSLILSTLFSLLSLSKTKTKKYTHSRARRPRLSRPRRPHPLLGPRARRQQRRHHLGHLPAQARRRARRHPASPGLSAAGARAGQGVLARGRGEGRPRREAQDKGLNVPALFKGGPRDR